MLVAHALLGLSLSRPASCVAIITGTGERGGWLMAVGIDLGSTAPAINPVTEPVTLQVGTFTT
jgi:hypothetical protein